MRKRPKVLVVDTERPVLEEIEQRLGAEGFDIDACTEYESAWQRVSGDRYAAVIARYESSTGNFCRKLREMDHSVPIILMYRISGGFDWSETLKKGCDDFIVKPFGVSELAVRVRMALGRTERDGLHVHCGPRENTIHIDGLYIDPLRRIVLVDGKQVDLTVIEFNILHLLASNRGRAYSRRELISPLWDYDAEVYEHTVNSHINRLRNKTERDPRSPRYIVIVWGVGHRFGDGSSVE